MPPFRPTLFVRLIKEKARKIIINDVTGSVTIIPVHDLGSRTSPIDDGDDGWRRFVLRVASGSRFGQKFHLDVVGLFGAGLTASVLVIFLAGIRVLASPVSPHIELLKRQKWQMNPQCTFLPQRLPQRFHTHLT